MPAFIPIIVAAARIGTSLPRIASAARAIGTSVAAHRAARASLNPGNGWTKNDPQLVRNSTALSKLANDFAQKNRAFVEYADARKLQITSKGNLERMASTTSKVSGQNYATPDNIGVYKSVLDWNKSNLNANLSTFVESQKSSLAEAQLNFLSRNARAATKEALAALGADAAKLGLVGLVSKEIIVGGNNDDVPPGPRPRPPRWSNNEFPPEEGDPEEPEPEPDKPEDNNDTSDIKASCADDLDGYADQGQVEGTFMFTPYGTLSTNRVL